MTDKHLPQNIVVPRARDVTIKKKKRKANLHHEILCICEDEHNDCTRDIDHIDHRQTGQDSQRGRQERNWFLFDLHFIRGLVASTRRYNHQYNITVIAA